MEDFSVPYFAEMCFGRKMPFRKTRKGKCGIRGVAYFKEISFLIRDILFLELQQVLRNAY